MCFELSDGLLFTALQALCLGWSAVCCARLALHFGWEVKKSLPLLVGALLGLMLQAAACQAGIGWASAVASSTGEIPIPWVLLWLLCLAAAAFLTVAAVGMFALSCLAAAGGKAEKVGQPPQS